MHALSHSVVADSFVTPWTLAHRLLCPWDFRDKSTGVGCCFLLHGCFLTRGWNLKLLSLPVLVGGFSTTEPLCQHKLWCYCI